MKSGNFAATLSPEKQDFLDRFVSFWSKPSGSRVAELIAPDAQIHFSGESTMSGVAYCDYMDAILANFKNVKVSVADYAERGETLFIFWEATGLVSGVCMSWHGVDRFRIRSGMAIEEHVIFDSQQFQQQQD